MGTVGGGWYIRVSELLARFENYVYFAMNLALLNWS